MSTPEDSPIDGTMQFPCGQKDCHELATCRFAWPGKDESLACEAHGQRAKGVAQAMGMYLQVRPL